MVSSKRSVLVVLLGILLATFTFACGNSETIPLHTMDPKSDVTRDIQGLYIILFWAATAVFFAVMIGLVYITFKFKRKPSDSMPPNSWKSSIGNFMDHTSKRNTKSNIN